MVAPSDDSPGRWKYFSSSKYPSNNLQGVDTYIRPSCSPNRVPLLLGQVLFVSAEAPGLSDQAPLTAKCSEPSAWDFFLLPRSQTVFLILCFHMMSLCYSFSRCNFFFNLLSLNFQDVSRSLRVFWDFSNSSLWIWLSSSSHCRSDRRLLITAACWAMAAFCCFTISY